VIIDTESPPGAWKTEMERMPWRFSQQVKVEQALAAMRQAGLVVEATVLALEIKTLKDELKLVRPNGGPDSAR
jgi:hypothetical protein